MGSIITFEGERFFVEALAEYLLAVYGDRLSDTRVILPSMNMLISLKDTLYQHSGKEAVLLPYFHTLAALEPQDWFKASDLNSMSPPNIVNSEQRMVWVAELVQEQLPQLSFVTALKYAESFLALRDDCQRAQQDVAIFESLVPDQYAQHWQDALALFYAIMTGLDSKLETQGLTEPIISQNRFATMLCDYWEAQPPQMPVIIAGSTGSIPSSAQLMKAVARQPEGCVVLPGLDMVMQDRHWDAISYTHPQYHLKQFLMHLELTRKDVHCISHVYSNPLLPNLTMLPEQAGDEVALHPLPVKACEGIELYSCNDDIAEVEMTTLLILDALHRGDEHILIVSENQDYIERLDTLLASYHVPLNHFTGALLTSHEAYRFMIVVAQCCFADYASIHLLALLKHPYCLAHLEDVQAVAQRFDAKIVRGLHDIESMAQALQAYEREYKADAAIESLREAFPHKPLYESQPFARYIEQHIAVMEQLAPEQLQDAITSQLIESLRHFATMMGHIMCQPHEYSDMLAHAFAGQTVHDERANRSAIEVLGVLEMRMRKADVIIVPHLNEGTWPRQLSAEPWLNHAMRTQAGLNFAERQVGLAAHDISMMLKAPRIVFMRAAKEQNSPTQPSRFYERLMLVCHKASERITQQQALWQEQLRLWRQARQLSYDVPTIQKPAPNPSLDARMKSLSATTCEKLMQNPFTVFISHICRISEREHVDERFSPKYFGIVAHDAMHKAAAHYDVDEIAPYQDALTRQFQQELAEHVPHTQRQFYMKKLNLILQSIIAEEEVRLTEVQSLLAEHMLKAQHMVEGRAISFSARVDRVESLRTSWRLIDYKTGEMPRTPQVLLGLSCQLLVAGWLARQQGEDIAALEYWSLKGREDMLPRSRVKAALDNDAFWHGVEQGLQQLAAYYCGDARAVFVWDEDAPMQGAAAHLARVGEW